MALVGTEILSVTPVNNGTPSGQTQTTTTLAIAALASAGNPNPDFNTVTFDKGITASTAAAGLTLKRGSNGKVGSFSASSTSVVVIANTLVAITDAVIISLQSLNGTPTLQPYLVGITASTGFNVAAGSGDFSTYNYTIISNSA